MDDQTSTVIETAKAFLKQHYAKNKHHVACLLACKDKQYLALHLDSRGFDTCAEPMALSNALLDGQTEFTTIVAVGMDDAGDPLVIPPCGNCRQILVEYCPEIKVLLSVNNVIQSVAATELLPYPY